MVLMLPATCCFEAVLESIARVHCCQHTKVNIWISQTNAFSTREPSAVRSFVDKSKTFDFSTIDGRGSVCVQTRFSWHCSTVPFLPCQQLILSIIGNLNLSLLAMSQACSNSGKSRFPIKDVACSLKRGADHQNHHVRTSERHDLTTKSSLLSSDQVLQINHQTVDIRNLIGIRFRHRPFVVQLWSSKQKDPLEAGPFQSVEPQESDELDIPYFFMKRSTRPAVSTIFCFPV